MPIALAELRHAAAAAVAQELPRPTDVLHYELFQNIKHHTLI